MRIREIKENEVYKLLACLEELAGHHNSISVNFRGYYPSRPFENTLKMFCTNLQNGQSRIAVAEKEDAVIGFCKIDMIDEMGKLDYLVVLKQYRGQGLGNQFMNWAMENFHKHGIAHIEVKVVDGNDAIHLYEKFGFRINSHILWYCEDDKLE